MTISKGEYLRLIKHNGMIKFIAYIPCIAMLSGGQDSSAMTLRLLELGEPVDYIVFSDTTLEFDEMYEYIDKLDAFFKRKYGIAITRIKARKSFEHWVFGEVTSGEMEGQIRGLPLIAAPCYWRRECKDLAFKDFIKQTGIKEFKTYVGYVLHEYERWKDIGQYGAIAPLVEWKWNEAEVRDYLRENMMENKLYQHFTRTGCGICPKQGDEALYTVYKHYPKQWKYMVDLEHRLKRERE